VAERTKAMVLKTVFSRFRAATVTDTSRGLSGRQGPNAQVSGPHKSKTSQPFARRRHIGRRAVSARFAPSSCTFARSSSTCRCNGNSGIVAMTLIASNQPCSLRNVSDSSSKVTRCVVGGSLPVLDGARMRAGHDVVSHSAFIHPRITEPVLPQLIDEPRLREGLSVLSARGGER
jgi:hypothetical protein